MSPENRFTVARTTTITIVSVIVWTLLLGLGIRLFPAIRNLFFPANASSPIKVGGGAMTFRIDPTKTPQNLGWQIEIKDANGNPTGYCAVYEASNLKLDGDWHGNPTAPGLAKQGWSLTLNGADPTTDPPTASPNGIMVVEDSSPCNGAAGSGGFALHLKPIINTPSGFYNTFSFPIRHEANGYQGVRFEDMSPKCAGPSPVLSTATGDEDACERLTAMTLTVGAKTLSSNCDSRECEIEFY